MLNQCDSSFLFRSCSCLPSMLRPKRSSHTQAPPARDTPLIQPLRSQCRGLRRRRNLRRDFQSCACSGQSIGGKSSSIRLSPCTRRTPYFSLVPVTGLAALRQFARSSKQQWKVTRLTSRRGALSLKSREIWPTTAVTTWRQLFRLRVSPKQS